MDPCRLTAPPRRNLNPGQGGGASFHSGSRLSSGTALRVQRADHRWVISSQSSGKRQIQSALDHLHSAACFPPKENRRCTCRNSGGFSPIKTADHWTDVLFVGSA